MMIPVRSSFGPAAVAPAPPGGQAPACRPSSPCSSAGGSSARSAGSPSGAALLILPAAGVSPHPAGGGRPHRHQRLDHHEGAPSPGRAFGAQLRDGLRALRRHQDEAPVISTVS
jgi:hypothetical protein